MLHCLPYDRDLAHRRNGHDLDSCGQRFKFRIRRMNAAISRKPSRRMSKELLVVRERLQPLSMLVRMREKLIAGDEPSFHFIELAPFDQTQQAPPFVPGNDPCLRLKETEHFVGFLLLAFLAGHGCVPGR